MKRTGFKPKPTWKKLEKVSKNKERAKRRFVPNDIIKQVKERSGGICEFVYEEGNRCTNPSERTPHHLLKRSQGGLHTLDNLRDSCWPHNMLAETHKEECIRVGWNIPYEGFVLGSLED